MATVVMGTNQSENKSPFPLNNEPAEPTKTYTPIHKLPICFVNIE
jgi:hypothetical protein